ncbi:MAG TPA: 7TM diverse intracellular signaling domain-containing protein, partial [Flavisolibacter sp.]
MWLRILFSSFLSIGIQQLCNAQIIISINHTNEKANISNQTGFFTDTTDAIPFSDIISGSYDDKFMVPGENKKGPPGIIRTSIWCHFGIRNQTDEKLILVIDNAHTADLYYSHRGRFYHKASSIYQPFYARDIRSNRLSFLLDIARDSTRQFYLKLQTNSGTRSPLVVHTINSWIEREHHILILDGIYMGVMIIMILYNLFIFLAIRDRSYLFYVLYVAFMTLTNMNIKSISFEFLWPNTPVLNHYVNI